MAKDQDAPDIQHTERRAGDTTFGVICLLFALFLLSQMTSQTVWAPGQGFAAQPGFWPRLAVIGMTVLAAMNLYGSWRDRRRDERFTAAGEEVLLWVRSLEFALWFMAYVFATPIIGYLAATVLFAVTLSVRVGYRSFLALGSAVGAAVVTVLIFKSFLQVKIPGGAVYEALPATIRNFFILYL